MKTFFIVTRRKDASNEELISQMKKYIEERGGTCASYLCPPSTDLTGDLEIPSGTECIFTVGGDGTMVRLAHSIVGSEIPILGVNRGHLGYLCDLDDKTVFDAIDRLMEDDYETEDRMMLSGSMGDTTFHALNDVVIGSDSRMNLIRLSVYINGSFLYSYNCDGMIFSTPTGSTAYNLSAGGPIVDPKNQVILLTPINPHTLNSRPIVLDPRDEVTVMLESRHEDMKESAKVLFDGAVRYQMACGEKVLIRRSKSVTKMVRLSQMNFLERMSEKLQEN